MTDKKTMWIALLALSIAFAPVPIDYAGVMVALPSMQKSLLLSHNQMHWVVNVYLLSLSCFIVLAGKLASYFSPRNLFLSGIALFAVTSVFCAVAQDASMLIVSRFIQGVGAALITTMQGLLLLQIFPAHLLGRANGLRVMISCSFMVFSPILGGFFSEYMSWRWLFWINLPVTFFGFYMGWKFLPDKKPKIESKHVDFLGFILSSIVIVTLTIGVMQSIDWGWFSLRTLSMFVVAIISSILFYYVSKDQDYPFLDVNILKQRSFFVVTFVVLFARMISIASVFISIFFQMDWGYPPFLAGLMMLPGALGVVLMGPIAGTMIDRFGPRITLMLSTLLMTVGTAGTVMLCPFHHYLYLMPFMVLTSAGSSVTISNSAIISLTYVKENQRPMASGVSSFARQFGALFGMTVGSTIVSHVLLHHSYVLAFMAAMSVAAVAGFFAFLFALRLPHETIRVE